MDRTRTAAINAAGTPFITLALPDKLHLNVERRGPHALITKDNLRVDLSAEFYIKVQANADDIVQAALAGREDLRNAGERGREEREIGERRHGDPARDHAHVGDERPAPPPGKGPEHRGHHERHRVRRAPQTGGTTSTTVGGIRGATRTTRALTSIGEPSGRCARR